MTSVFGEIWEEICGGIFTLQITDMTDLHGIKITDDLRNYYKLLEVPRFYLSHANRAYVNWKKLHSINTQIVFDTCYNILDIVAKWPGSTQDSGITMESGLTQLFAQMPLLLAIHVFIAIF